MTGFFSSKFFKFKTLNSDSELHRHSASLTVCDSPRFTRIFGFLPYFKSEFQTDFFLRVFTMKTNEFKTL